MGGEHKSCGSANMVSATRAVIHAWQSYQRGLARVVGCELTAVAAMTCWKVSLGPRAPPTRLPRLRKRVEAESLPTPANQRHRARCVPPQSLRREHRPCRGRLYPCLLTQRCLPWCMVVLIERGTCAWQSTVQLYDSDQTSGLTKSSGAASAGALRAFDPTVSPEAHR